MSKLSGFVEKGKEFLVCKLNRALYGLHQSGRMWFFEMNRILIDIGFVKFSWCSCVYAFKGKVI